MEDPKKLYYEKRASVLIKNLNSRHFDAYYCPDKASALKKALELIIDGASVGWGGAMSAQQIGLIDALKAGNYQPIDRSSARTPEEKLEVIPTPVPRQASNSGIMQTAYIDPTNTEVGPVPGEIGSKTFLKLKK